MDWCSLNNLVCLSVYTSHEPREAEDEHASGFRCVPRSKARRAPPLSTSLVKWTLVVSRGKRDHHLPPVPRQFHMFLQGQIDFGMRGRGTVWTRTALLWSACEETPLCKGPFVRGRQPGPSVEGGRCPRQPAYHRDCPCPSGQVGLSCKVASRCTCRRRAIFNVGHC